MTISPLSMEGAGRLMVILSKGLKGFRLTDFHRWRNLLTLESLHSIPCAMQTRTWRRCSTEEARCFGNADIENAFVTVVTRMMACKVRWNSLYISIVLYVILTKYLVWSTIHDRYSKLVQFLLLKQIKDSLKSWYYIERLLLNIQRYIMDLLLTFNSSSL